ncbi:hypothetical protein PSH98_20570 [Pseudoalteromonas sp. Angola-18]|nr:DUF6689 family protein [Pseudoalteromonas sp. Angola-18]MDC9503889.1 hypothetical protein [Pseudoalteromonas sp. Angola-18]
MSSQVEATDIVSVNIHGNSAEAIIELPGGVSADITLEFENAVGLTAQNLGISAEVVDITSQALLQRLPSITEHYRYSTVSCFSNDDNNRAAVNEWLFFFWFGNR